MRSMMRGPSGFLPRLTARSRMSRMVSVISLKSPPSFRGGASAPNPESRDSGFASSRRPGMTEYVLSSFAAFALLHAGIERIARGVADQIDAQDRDRQQKARPEDQRGLDLEVGAALGHDVAPGRRLRADAGAEEGQDRFGENGGSADI